MFLFPNLHVYMNRQPFSTTMVQHGRRKNEADKTSVRQWQ